MTHTTSYIQAHRKVRKEKGPATDYLCVDCGDNAHEWSYDYSDPEPLMSGTSAFSFDVFRYEPRCRICHDAFERRADPNKEVQIARRARLAGEGMKRRLAAPGGRDVFIEAGRRAAAKRRRCSECGKVCAPGPMARHQRSSGHTGHEDVKG